MRAGAQEAVQDCETGMEGEWDSRSLWPWYCETPDHPHHLLILDFMNVREKSISILSPPVDFSYMQPDLILTDTHPMIRGHKKHDWKEKLHMKELCWIYCFTQTFYIKQAKTNDSDLLRWVLTAETVWKDYKDNIQGKNKSRKKGESKLWECKEALKLIKIWWLFPYISNLKSKNKVMGIDKLGSIHISDEQPSKQSQKIYHWFNRF